MGHLVCLPIRWHSCSRLRCDLLQACFLQQEGAVFAKADAAAVRGSAEAAAAAELAVAAEGVVAAEEAVAEGKAVAEGHAAAGERIAAEEIGAAERAVVVANAGRRNCLRQS